MYYLLGRHIHRMISEFEQKGRKNFQSSLKSSNKKLLFLNYANRVLDGIDLKEKKFLINFER